MAKITHLPNEVIATILKNKNVSIKGIMRFKSTCKRLHRLVLSNYFWKKKFYQRCSPATKMYYSQKSKKTFYHIDLEKRIRTGIKCVKKLHYYVSLMSDNNISKTNKKKLCNLLFLTVKKSMIYHFVSDEINRITSTQLPWPFENLTIKYNFGEIFNCLKLCRYMYKLTKFLNKPYKKQLLERQITIAAQFFLPHVSYSVVKTWLDDIAQEVLSRLKIKYPAHSIFPMSLKQFRLWRTNNICDNYWNRTESIQIMRTLEEYIFSKLDVDTFLQLLTVSDVKAKHKACISEFFRGFLLPIVYHSVARRLGIRCILVPIYESFENSPREHIKIVWKPKYNTEAWDNAEYFYIKDDNLTYPSNIFRGKYYNNASPRLLNNGRKLDFGWSWYPLIMTDTQIIKNMLQYFMDEKLSGNENYKWIFYNLIEFLNTANRNKKQTLNEEYIKRKCYKEITEIIQKPTSYYLNVPREKRLKERKQELKYAVGMIVTYRRRNLFHNLETHDGVIIGWKYEHHKVFLKQLITHLRYISDTFQVLYLCHHVSQCMYEGFSGSGDQPHYIILTENNRICYARQDRISICPPKEFNNKVIGRFFCRFEGTHYVLNKSLEEIYPNDTAAISKILFNHSLITNLY